MVSAGSITDRIVEWKAVRGAAILAHHYQDEEIQDIADCVGDSLHLARAACEFEGKVIAVCGARFMAETVKILNPRRAVILPDLKAGCSLVDSCPVAAVRAFKQRNPDYAVVSSLHTSAEVKAESHLVCTVQNAVAAIHSIAADKPILFVPDSNLGRWVKKQTGRRNMQIWQGACIVHATFGARRLATARFEHPGALVAAHPGCGPEIVRQADFVGSTKSLIEWCARQAAQEFILVTESGIRFSLARQCPDKRFYFVANENCNCSECPYLRVNTLEKLLICLETLTPRIELPDDIIKRARAPIGRMLELK